MIAGAPPFLIFAAGALALLFIPERWRPAWTLFTPLAGLVNLLALESGVHWRVGILDYELVFGRIDKLSLLFALLFHIAAALGAIFALHVRDTVQQASALLYAAGALGAVFAGDLLSLFVFWEAMAVASVFLVWAGGTERATRAGLRYLAAQVASGVLLLAGALIHHGETGSLEFAALSLDGLGAKLIFIAFGVKCAWPFLHSWLTDAYPEATPTGTVFLSAFTTKVAVYALARSFAGTEILIWIGAAMAMFPIFYAVIENDLRRVLAYSLINQVGFMVVGVGLGTALALNGAVSHAFNDVVFKGLLFMSMGAVLHMTGRIDGTDLGGLYKTMPWTTGFCLVGAASISAFPLFSGFVSKSMVMTSAAEEGYVFVFLCLLFASAGVFHHAGIKIPYFAFFAHDSGIRTSDPPRNMLAAMAIAAAICVFNGAYPWVLYDLLPWDAAYEPYTATHVITQLQLLFFSALAFALLMLSGLYPPEMKLVNLDTDWLLRRPARRAATATGSAAMAVWSGGLERLRAAALAARPVWGWHGPRGAVARAWSTGASATAIMAFLAFYLVFFYV